MEKSRYLLIIFLTYCLTNCAALAEMNKQQLIEHCNPLNAYNQGLRKGLIPHEIPEYNYASACETNKDVINSEYLRGFTEGIKSRPPEITIHKDIGANTIKDTR